jgi:hypothetical protein
MSHDETIFGLKANVKRGFSLADFWMGSYKETIALTLQSWKMIEDAGLDMAPVVEMAWLAVQQFKHYREVDSAAIGKMSVIRDMVIPAKTYTTKKGVEKTKPEERVPSHFTAGGTYLGRVSALGAEPISYRIELQITPAHFKFVCVNTTLAGCFLLKADADVGADVAHKDLPRKKAVGGAGTDAE